MFLFYFYIYTVSNKKYDSVTLILPVTLPKFVRFSQFFHLQTQQSAVNLE